VGGPFVPVLVRLAESCGAKRVLELGPGTGNVSAAFQSVYPCRLIGGELSEGMLAKAVAKGIPGSAWVRSNAMAIPLADASVDFVFGCYMLHYIPELRGLFGECRRVLRPGGVCAFVTTAHDYIRRHPMTRFFPSFAPIDLARFPSEEALVASMRDTGLEQVGCDTVSEPRAIDRAYAAKVAARFLSTFDLMTDTEFNEGVERLNAALEPTGRIDCETGWEALIVHGQRAAA
jgi:SAM-dependent methyltransferase